MEIAWKSTGPILVFIAITASAIPFLLYFRHLSIEYVLLIVMLGTLGFCWGYYRRYASSSPAESGTADNQGYPGETGQPVNDPSIPVTESLRLPQQDQESAPDPAEGTKAPPKDLIGRLLLAFIHPVCSAVIYCGTYMENRFIDANYSVCNFPCRCHRLRLDDCW